MFVLVVEKDVKKSTRHRERGYKPNLRSGYTSRKHVIWALKEDSALTGPVEPLAERPVVSFIFDISHLKTQTSQRLSLTEF